jgi:hypothetical protein
MSKNTQSPPLSRMALPTVLPTAPAPPDTAFQLVSIYRLEKYILLSMVLPSNLNRSFVDNCTGAVWAIAKRDIGKKMKGSQSFQCFPLYKSSSVAAKSPTALCRGDMARKSSEGQKRRHRTRASCMRSSPTPGGAFSSALLASKLVS